MADAGDSQVIDNMKPSEVKKAPSYSPPTEAAKQGITSLKPTRKSNGNLGRGMR